MALTKESMADFIMAAIASAGAAQTSDPATAVSSSRALLEAWCQGIIDEIQTNGECYTTSGAPDSEHTGKLL